MSACDQLQLQNAKTLKWLGTAVQVAQESPTPGSWTVLPFEEPGWLVEEPGPETNVAKNGGKISTETQGPVYGCSTTLRASFLTCQRIYNESPPSLATPIPRSA